MFNLLGDGFSRRKDSISGSAGGKPVVLSSRRMKFIIGHCWPKESASLDCSGRILWFLRNIARSGVAGNAVSGILVHIRSAESSIYSSHYTSRGRQNLCETGYVYEWGDI